MVESLLVNQSGGVLTVSINRADRGNALDPPTIDAMIELFDGLWAEPGDVRVVHLRSEGRHFCTGADIGGNERRGSELPGGKPMVGHMVRSLGRGPHRLIQVLWDCPLPVVAELTGRASGMGLHVALACDVTIAADTATFAEPFGERGFNVDSGGSWLLPRFVGLTRAKRLLYSSEVIDAATAEEWGLVSEVVAADDLAGRVAEVCAGLADRATYALASMKTLLHRHLTADLHEAMTNEASAVELTIRSDDFKAGMKAFVQKEPPTFSGR